MNQKNQNIIERLNDLVLLYKKDPKLKFKYSAIEKALSYIKNYPHLITSGDYAKKNLPNIGTGIARRIDEILETGTLQELANTPSNTELDNINDLKRITGIGDARAKSLVKQGIKSVDDFISAVKKGKVQTTHHIDIGIKYFRDLEERIPREEIEKMEKIIASEITNIGTNLIFNICGSYRRGCATCGDIDVLFTCANQSKNHHCKNYLSILVKNLTAKKFLIDHLTEKGNKKYMGICKLSDLARRIDIRFVEYPAYYAALVYFTGSKNFNIQIRNKAIELGYSLSEYGFKKGDSDELIMVHSEEELFKILGIPYLKPSERDI